MTPLGGIEMYRSVTRNHAGRRTGASHPKAKADDRLVLAARQLREKRGWSYLRIATHLNTTQGLTLSKWTVRDWVDYRTRASA